MPPETPAPPVRPRQRGASLIEVLVSLLIFSFGLLGLAALYVRAAPAPYENQTVIAVQSAADSLMAVLAEDPDALSSLSVSNVSSPKNMPGTPPLDAWLAQAQVAVPSLSVTITPGADALGNSCTQFSCGITAVLSWTDGSVQRSQTFHGQIGIHS